MEGDLVSGIRHAQDVIEGSMTILLLTEDAIITARDKMGRLPVHIGKSDLGHSVSFESFAYHKLGYEDAYELGPSEIVRITADGYETLSPAASTMKICAFLWTYYGYPNSNYEGVNVELMRYRNGEIMARDEMARGTLPQVDHVAGVPDSGTPHAIGYANRLQAALCPALRQIHPHLAALLHARQSGRAQSGGQDEADSRAGTHSGQKAPLCGRLHRARHAAARNRRFSL